MSTASSPIACLFHRDAYAEKVIWLPHSYMPHDVAGRAISDARLARADFGLPERGVVFCCFNNAYKLNPEIFASRMRILKAVEDSVLWLSESHPAAIENLRKAASECGVDPARLVFCRAFAVSGRSSGAPPSRGSVPGHLALQRAHDGERCVVGGLAGADADRKDLCRQGGS